MKMHKQENCKDKFCMIKWLLSNTESDFPVVLGHHLALIKLNLLSTKCN